MSNRISHRINVQLTTNFVIVWFSVVLFTIRGFLFCFVCFGSVVVVFFPRFSHDSDFSSR